MPPHTQPSADVYRDLVDVAPDAMIALDAVTSRIRLVNAQAERVFGHCREDLVGRPVEVLLPAGVRRAVAPHRIHGLDGAVAGADRHGCELLARHRDGHEFPVEVWSTPLAGHRPGLLAVAVRDVSERRAAQEAHERMRDELLATVSHELRTPLTSILGYTEVLAEMGEDALSEHAAKLLAVVRRNAQRELKLVEDMLALAFLGTSSLTVRPRPTDLAVVVRTVLDELDGPARQAGIAVTSDGRDSLWVVGDPQRLVQVLTNLVGNAIKFTPSGGVVEVRLLVDGAHGLLEVEDQGIGVDPEELPRVFDRLYRSPGVVAAHLPGAGLGLPVVKGIVDAHEGEVDVESRPGHGTKVQVRLPLATAELAG